MNTDKPSWYQQIAGDDVSVRLKYNTWCEIAGALQQLVIDLNQENPVNTQELSLIARQIETVLHSYRDTKVPQWGEFSK